MNDLSGKYALVTGGGTGIGRGIAIRLLEAGAKVTIAGRREDVLTAAASDLQSLCAEPDDVKIAVCDVTKEDDVHRAVAIASNADGVLDISVANAGIGAGGPFLTMDADTFRSVLEVNVIGAFNTIQASAATMRLNGGSIIAISSIAGALGG